MKFRKKPVVIEAVLWEGGRESMEKIKSFLGDDFICWWFNHDTIGIHTAEGDMKASKGDYIIRGVKGEHYACKPDIFKQTYEPVEE